MTVAHYRINELDSDDRVVDGYSVMCRSDAAALATASKGAENRAAAHGMSPVLTPVTPWHRRRWTGQPAASPLNPTP